MSPDDFQVEAYKDFLKIDLKLTLGGPHSLFSRFLRSMPPYVPGILFEGSRKSEGSSLQYLITHPQRIHKMFLKVMWELCLKDRSLV